MLNWTRQQIIDEYTKWKNLKDINPAKYKKAFEAGKVIREDELRELLDANERLSRYTAEEKYEMLKNTFLLANDNYKESVKKGAVFSKIIANNDSAFGSLNNVKYFDSLVNSMSLAADTKLFKNEKHYVEGLRLDYPDTPFAGESKDSAFLTRVIFKDEAYKNIKIPYGAVSKEDREILENIVNDIRKETGTDNFILVSDSQYPFGGKGLLLSHKFNSPEFFVHVSKAAEIVDGERYIINSNSNSKILIQKFINHEWHYVWED